jgi:hypothetical protein
MYHKDKETNQALIRLLDSLSLWERNTSRRSTLILIPHNSDEKIMVAIDGKPLSKNSSLSINQAINLALRERIPKKEAKE